MYDSMSAAAVSSAQTVRVFVSRLRLRTGGCSSVPNGSPEVPLIEST